MIYEPIDQYNLRFVMVGVTARCNAMCPGCPRNIDGTKVDYDMIGPASNWDMPIELFKKFFTTNLINTLNEIEFCGTFGDPCIHPDIIEMVKYLKENHNSKKRLRCYFSTNGSMQTNQFWKTLGSLNNDDEKFIVSAGFCLDGSNQESHVKYRRLTDFDTILSNAKSFMQGGGHASWQFIKFDHNDHEVDEAKAMSKELGFFKFQIKSGQGRLSGYLENEVEGKEAIYASKNKKNKEEKIYVNESDSYKKMKEKFEEITKKKIDKINKNEMQKALDEIPVVCSWDKNNDNGILFEYDGSVMRCCYHGTFTNKKEWIPIEERYGLGWNNIKNYDLKTILSHEFFASYLPESFANPNGPFKRLRSCSEACGLHIPRK